MKQAAQGGDKSNPKLVNMMLTRELISPLAGIPRPRIEWLAYDEGSR